MKYIRIKVAGLPEAVCNGVLEGGTIHVTDASPLDKQPLRTGRKISINEVESFLPPVEAPNIIALGLNYAEHARETLTEPPVRPVVFIKSITALTGHMASICLPREAPDFVDYEAELTVVIGKRAKNISEEDAPQYILGYTCGNDVSARDCQMKLDKQWARAKSFDTFAPVGPCIVTDIDPANLEIISRVNGKVMQKASTSDMLFNVPRIVAYLSRQMTLLPGTLIMTGTPHGVGHARDPQVFLREGDTVEVEIEDIGTLKNVVTKEV